MEIATTSSSPLLQFPKPKVIALPTIWNFDEQNRLVLSLHAGQGRAWESQARFIALLAGTQGGKTSFAPWWLAREIELTADEGGSSNDYLAITATFDLFKLKFLPVMLECFEHVLGIGRYWASDRLIELSDPRDGTFWADKAADRMWGRIILRAASAGSGLESATARGAVLDEAGQGDYTIETWEAVRRRLSIFQGRALLPTTVYDLGWLKKAIYDRAKRVDTPHEQPGDREFGVLNFDSIENPTFSRKEFESARQAMPAWRFDMMYRGLFTRPAGQIYDCFIDADESEGGHRVRGNRVLPPHWQNVAGLDFGVVNTCVGIYAVEEDGEGYPTGKLILKRTYHAGSRNTTEHVAKIREIEPNIALAVGGAASENQWRRAYLWAGLPVYAPTITNVEVGIDRVYGATKQGKILVFDTEQDYIEQKKDYSRELDENGDPTTVIKDKAKYHFLDQERYMASLMCPGDGAFLPFVARRHMIVGEAATKTYPATYTRFAGMYYQEGSPCAFVLCVVDETGKVVATHELVKPGVGVSDFVTSVVSLIKTAGLEKSDVLITANDDLFLSIEREGMNGASIAESFRNAGLVLVQANADGMNEWAVCSDWLTRDRFAVSRTGCPFLSLTMPLIVAEVSDSSKTDNTSKPDPRSPLAAAQALCYALMTRPEASTLPEAVAPKQHKRVHPGMPAQAQSTGTRSR